MRLAGPLVAIAIVILGLISSALTIVTTDPTALLDHVLDSYDKRIRPFADVDKPVIIDMTIVLGILTELRENQQVMAVVISHVQKWTDPKLTWDVEKFHGVRQIVIPQDLVWVPKLFIYNSMDTKDMLSENRYDIRVEHNGRVKINIPQYVTCICRLSIELFPFDTQFCAIALASPLLNTEEMDVNATQPPKDSYFAGNAEWEVINVTVRHLKFREEGEYRAEVHYIMHLHRRPVYYLTVIVAPTFLISALSILGIFSPGCNDGPRSEKVSLGLGSLLALTVLLDIVANTMPKSNSVPLLGYYIIAVIILCAVAVGISMGYLALSRQFIQTEKMPSALAYKCLWMEPQKRRIDYWLASEYSENDEIQLPKFPDLIAIYNQIHEIAMAQKTFRKKLEKQRRYHMVECEWNRLFSRFDYFFLFLFQALNVIILMLFLRNAWLPLPELPADFMV
uniref:Neur_chan_LBD domain-containing protein n=1 Tax=Panagrellus redivivus TaxID=6233 RepID=A0A7E4ZSM1_PANRE